MILVGLPIAANRANKYKDGHMNNRLRLRSEKPVQTPALPVARRSANPAYLALLVLVLSVGTASMLAWYHGDFSVENRAASGEAKALYLLGKSYFDTAISPRDYVRAARLIRGAADQGYAAAQAAMGLLYEHGLGVTRNYEVALHWLCRAAQQGYPIAQNELGVMFAKGHGTSQDFSQAIKWFRLAAAQGSEIARRNLELAETTGSKMIAQLTTSNKCSYGHAVLQKIERDGVTVSFTPKAGGFGLAKLKMENLPSDLKQLCKYAAKEGQASNSAYSQLGAISTTL